MIEGPIRPDSPAAPMHSDALDGLRGCAILLVVLHRFDVVDPSTSAGHWIAHGLALGWVGVQLFFVLSGFLITTSLFQIRSAKNYYRVFYWRRVLRIFPVYFGTLFVAFIIAPAMFDLSADARAQLAHPFWLLVFLTNWLMPFGVVTPAFPHFWSLAVEEQFYLVWPAVVRRLSNRGLTAVLIAIVLVAPISRGVASVVFNPEIGASVCYLWTICRADALAAGALIAVLMRHANIVAALMRSARISLPLVAVAIIGGAFVSHGFMGSSAIAQMVGYSTLCALFATTVLMALLAPNTRSWTQCVLCHPALVQCGKFSYAIYVFHTPLHLFVLWPLARSISGRASLPATEALLYFVVAFFVIYASAWLSHRLIEGPALRMRRFVTPEV